ncbi:MAG: RluA family pseudouridine synthase [Planctomycetota bacterium]
MADDIYKLHRVRLALGGRPLFEALSAAVPGLSRQQARRALVAGLVTLDGKQIQDPKACVPDAGASAELDLRQGLRKTWVRARHGVPPTPITELTLLHLDGDLCMIDKPCGVLSVPPPSQPGAPRARGHVGDLLRRQLGRKGRETGYIGVVHRLDQDTSGCLVIALTREAHRLLAAQFAGTSAVRTYRCFVAGSPPQDAGEISGKQGRGEDGRRAMVDEDEAGVEAVTRYKVVRRLPTATELEVELGTGRTHQVRVALSSIGCPVLGDRLYARQRSDAHAARLMLHAWALEVDHPRLGNRLRVESPLPAAWISVVETLIAAPPSQSQPRAAIKRHPAPTHRRRDR